MFTRDAPLCVVVEVCSMPQWLVNPDRSFHTCQEMSVNQSINQSIIGDGSLFHRPSVNNSGILAATPRKDKEEEEEEDLFD